MEETRIRSLAAAGVLALAVAGLSWAAGRYGYVQAVEQIAQRGQASLTVASDRLESQLLRYRETAALLTTHPDLLALAAGGGPAARAQASAMLLATADTVSAVDVSFATPGGEVLAAALGPPGTGSGGGEALAPDPRSDHFQRALQGALGAGHGRLPGGRRLFFYSAPLFAPEGGVAGVVTLSVDAGRVESEWRGGGPAVFFTDSRGEVFLSNRSELVGWQRRSSAAPPGAAGPVQVSQVAGHELWRLDWGPYLPGHGLHLTQSLPAIGMEGEAIVDVAPAVRLAQLQGAIVAALGLLFAMALAWAQNRRRTLARANAALEERVQRRTADLSEANAMLRREVRERQEAEAALKRAQDDLVQAGKLSALGQMSAGISHELNQPLMAIGQFAENAGLLLDQGDRDAAARNLGRISELARRMGRIIRNLRAFARQESAPAAQVDMVKVVEAALEISAPRLREAGVALDWQPPAAPVWVRGGEVRLQQVLMNLVSNAVDAMQPSEIKELRVTLEEKDEVTLRVADTGPGIETPERIFDPFYTTKEVGAAKGMGLGLSISYGLVQSFGGSIRGRNRDGGGAEFTVTLPPWSEARAA